MQRPMSPLNWSSWSLLKKFKCSECHSVRLNLLPVERELLPTTLKVTQQLMDFADSGSQVPKPLHANHTAGSLGATAQTFDATARTATESIIKSPLSAGACDQAGVSTRFGGLGIRRIIDHAPVGFAASYHASLAQCEK